MKILRLYSEVFDDYGNVKNCGREKCKELISLCNSIDTGNTYGDLNTGRMEVEKVKSLIEKITQGE